jgi:CheY-like chemotaxis protein
MEAMGVLAGGIAHDFNNILTTILGNAQLGLMQIQPDNPLHKRFADIEKTAHKAAALTKQILAFSRRQPLEPRVIDINELITDFSKMLRRLIGEHIESDIVTTEKPCPVLADPNSLEQVLMNFAVNARDAMPDGGTFTITSERLIPDEKLRYRYPDLHSEEYVLITISDTGTGIPEKILSRIFEPFFTTKETGKGTGLGLSVVHGIIKQHNGVIDVDSKLNQGTTFKIYLPITHSSPAEKTDNVQSEIPRGSETVLIAEDETHLREMAVNALQSLGYTVLSSKDGEETVDIFKKRKDKIDIVIMDVRMPRLGGMEAYNKIQMIRKGIPVLFISGYSKEIDELLSVDIKYVDFLPKPFTMESLGEKVREILDKSQKEHK